MWLHRMTNLRALYTQGARGHDYMTEAMRAWTEASWALPKDVELDSFNELVQRLENDYKGGRTKEMWQRRC